MGEYAQAVADWTQLCLLDAANPRHLERRAQAFQVLGETRAALSDLAGVFEAEPQNVRVAAQLARLYAQVNDHQGVITALTPVLGRSFRHRRGLVLRVRAHKALGQNTAALTDDGTHFESG